MANLRDNLTFTSAILPGNSLLDEALEWIGNYLRPEDVFREEELHEWAMDHGYKIED